MSRPFIGRFLMLACAQGTQYPNLPKKHIRIGREALARGVRWSAGVPFLHFTGREKDAQGQWRDQEFCLMVRFWDGANETTADLPSGSLPSGASSDPFTGGVQTGGAAANPSGTSSGSAGSGAV